MSPPRVIIHAFGSILYRFVHTRTLSNTPWRKDARSRVRLLECELQLGPSRLRGRVQVWFLADTKNSVTLAVRGVVVPNEPQLVARHTRHQDAIAYVAVWNVERLSQIATSFKDHLYRTCRSWFSEI